MNSALNYSSSKYDHYKTGVFYLKRTTTEKMTSQI